MPEESFHMGDRSRGFKLWVRYKIWTKFNPSHLSMYINIYGYNFHLCSNIKILNNSPMNLYEHVFMSDWLPVQTSDRNTTSSTFRTSCWKVLSYQNYKPRGLISYTARNNGCHLRAQRQRDREILAQSLLFINELVVLWYGSIKLTIS